MQQSVSSTDGLYIIFLFNFEYPTILLKIVSKKFLHY